MDKKGRLPLQMDCVMLFQSEPARVESLEGLENRLGVSREELEPVMDLLVKQGIVQLIGEVTTPSFRYKEPRLEGQQDVTIELEKL